MSALIYYITLPFIHALAWLPLSVLYRLSDVLHFLVFRVLGYRRSVVRGNLARSFPERGPAERKAIEERFYRWFCDLIMETLKTLTITAQEVEDMVKVEGREVIERYHEQGRSVILVMGHWGNWELGGARFAGMGLHQLYVIYHPLQNKHFNDLIVRMRTRLGNRLYTMSETSKAMLRDRHLLTATAFIADQTPPPERAYWTTFLDQDTPVFHGTEKIARKLGYPVVYLGIDRPTRGRYVMRFEELVPDPERTVDGEISEAHTRRLEADIRSRPEIWLWTHRRWKHGSRPKTAGTL
ncbi:MAG: lysophospholipid acyltransferase family protein [Flavobacteriales bacterium]|nr:lysophospholipid acyltransferase family protein [Flavobacteriales bacterium]